MIALIGTKVFHKTLQETFTVIATSPGEVCVERTYRGTTKHVWFPEGDLRAV